MSQHPLFAQPGVHVRQEGKTIIVDFHQGLMSWALLGGNIPTNCPERGAFSTPVLTLHPEEGKGGIIALAIKQTSHLSKGRYTTDYMHGLFEVTWGDDGKPRLNADSSWYKDGLMFRTIVDREEHSGIEVNIAGGWVSSHNYHRSGMKTDKPLYVPDGNLLCRYLYGEAGADEVKATAIPLDEMSLKLASEGISKLVKIVHELRRSAFSIEEMGQRERREAEATIEGHRLALVAQTTYMRKVSRHSAQILVPAARVLSKISARWVPVWAERIIRLHGFCAFMAEHYGEVSLSQPPQIPEYG